MQQDLLRLDPHVLFQGLVARDVLLLFARLAAEGRQRLLEGSALHVLLRELVGDVQLIHRVACLQGLWYSRLDI